MLKIDQVLKSVVVLSAIVNFTGCGDIDSNGSKITGVDIENICSSIHPNDGDSGVITWCQGE